MKIAAFVNDHLEVTSFYEDGVVCLFDNHLGGWNCRQQIPLAITMDMGLAELKKTFGNIEAQLKGCEDFLIAASQKACSMSFSKTEGFAPGNRRERCLSNWTMSPKKTLKVSLLPRLKKKPTCIKAQLAGLVADDPPDALWFCQAKE